jgi:membrane-associated HD superfamily phosphohydrolase
MAVPRQLDSIGRKGSIRGPSPRELIIIIIITIIIINYYYHHHHRRRRRRRRRRIMFCYVDYVTMLYRFQTLFSNNWNYLSCK